MSLGPVNENIEAGRIDVLVSVCLEEISVSQCPIGPEGHLLSSNDVYRISAVLQSHLFNFKNFPLAKMRHSLWSC